MTERDRRRRILFVCTANICRSPSAESLARSLVGERRFIYRSAGFLAGGRKPPSTLVDVLGRRGLDISDHRSYNLDDPSVRAAHLLFTMENSHVQQATALVPTAFPKIVPIRQAAAILAEEDDAIPVEQFVARLNTNRHPEEYLGTNWDVADPYGGSKRDYTQMVAQVADLVTSVLGKLR